MPFTPKSVGDVVVILDSEGIEVGLAPVEEASPTKYVVRGLWYGPSGQGLGSAEEGSYLEDPDIAQQNEHARRLKYATLRALDWSLLSDADLDSVHTIISSYL